MTKKIKLTRTTIKTYEPDIECYPEGFTIEDMAKMDANSDDKELLFDDCDKDEIIWEIIED